ncbi:NADH:flavin oxidoreductase [Pseudomonas sp. S75]|uniref:oxidoreductase n=1 Tax=unclassified Pseudomonas TaxID=196821 RepID=UPI0019050C02|nr:MULTISPECIES: NADH:flavin oxidoreductase [unclassified Pseudomonas]MBJ9974796.1 NADH:flavin oxidoreductase [Pseudomonas sp. S30]MBK0152448.1 NADH:flavin oxidoreductase [Pseudomonas sp. S75]
MASGFPLTRQPLALGRHLALKNRVYFAPMGIDLGRDGCLTPAMFDFYKGIVDGGCAMVVLANSAVDASTRLHEGGLCLYEPTHAEHLAPLIDYGRHNACPVVVQLQHYGNQGHLGRSGGVLLTPSRSTPARSVKGMKVMTHEDARRVCAQFAHAARLAQQAGARMVQLQASNGYLLSSFLSPYSNRRTDRYGGTPLRRARLLLEVMDAIVDATQGGVDISVRLGIDDCLGEQGQQPALLEQVVPALERAGAAALMCSAAIKQTFHYMLRADPRVHAMLVHGVRHIRQLTSLPVGFAGFTGSLAQAEALLELGVTDLVGMSRALFADNDLVNKSLQGRPGSVNACRFEGNCFRDKSNPQLDRVYCCVNDRYKRPASIRYD